ncbi:unnamed protein product [Paramecium pentaurelia]|uniref:Myb-like DNA-binding domain protein n=1 Tax=Paramecium pentaurelia TaxID=43138 RepID=A0A8S1VHG4_9CILI|nr:unnamed protein product [Paramecium pentaurelia]
MRESRQNWNQYEDQQLQELHQIYGEQWKKIAELLHLQYKSQGKIRSAAACRERYQNILKPTLNKNQWTREEEIKLFSLQKLYGNCWTKITEKMKNRSELICKNYFYATIRRVLRRLCKQVGIIKPSLMLKSIKPSVLMSIYMENNQEIQLVFKEEVRCQLNQLITKYQFIQKEENIKIDNDEIQNIRQLIQELVNANQYLESKSEVLLLRKNKTNILMINQDQMQMEKETILKRIRLQQNIFIIRQPNFNHQKQQKEEIKKNSSINENNNYQQLIPIQNTQINENQFQNQENFNLYQTQAYFQNYMDYSKYVSQYYQQLGNYYSSYQYQYNQYNNYLLQQRY